MRALRTARLRLRSLLRGSRVEQELDDELRDHLERQIERHRAAGLSLADARAAALREFGNVGLIREQARDTWRVGWLDDVRRDAVYALRSMRRTPGFTAVAVLSIAAAIGPNTAIFTLVNTLLLRSLPVERPQDLMELGRATSNGPGNFSYPLYERVRDQATAFSDVITVSSPMIRGEEDPSGQSPVGRYVSGNFFAALGLRPVLGRLLVPADDRVDATTAVIGYGFWQKQFGADPGVIGKTLTLATPPERKAVATYSIVGVAPERFDGLTVGRVDDFYVPIATEARVSPRSMLRSPGAGWLKVVGRLKPEASPETAKADVDVIYARFLDDAAEFASAEVIRQQRGQPLTIASARGGLAGPRLEFEKPVLLLMGAVSLVLLVACVNLVNLLMARGLARRVEIGVRLGIGASRGRLVRQLLTEAALLGALGGGLGLALAVWGAPRIARLMANEDPTVAYDVAPDAAVLAFTVVVSLACALVAGLMPALRVSRAPAPSLRDWAGARGGRGPTTIWSRGLIAGQVALSLLLLAGALLLVTTLRNFRSGEFGFRREGVVTMRLEPGRAGYTGERRAAYYLDVLQRARSVPGVEGAALSLGMPVISTGVDSSFAVEGEATDPEASAFVNEVTDGYFAATGTRLLRGRDFGPQDRRGSTPVAIVNDALVRRYFGALDPLGQRVRVGIRGVVEIVGVVETATFESLRESDSPIVYGHAIQGGNLGPGLNLVVKTTTGEPSIGDAVRRAVVDAERVPVTPVSTLSAQIDRTLVKERLIARVLGAFAAVSVLLAAVGLYGLLAYTVSRRTNEIGVRLALGATRGAVLGPVLREAAIMVGLGVAIGIPAALASARVLESLLYGVAPTDAAVLAGVVLLLFAVAIAAASVPAWRASRIDPLIALRTD